MRKLMLLGLAALTMTAGAASVVSAQPRPMGDRDRDGLPNAYDSRPNNPNNGPMGDRDRDGRPNAVDPRDDRWDTRWGREVRPPQYWGARPGWNLHVRACFARYRSYNPRTDSYVVRRGVTARCRL
ncbi:MAG: BA14K family protein [Caulobacterales bacterium]|nr:BA14K family protein [Caulobacterales bacterium]